MNFNNKVIKWQNNENKTHLKKGLKGFNNRNDLNDNHFSEESLNLITELIRHQKNTRKMTTF
jgi:hypothetical protein